jgi:hypothetical protein
MEGEFRSIIIGEQISCHLKATNRFQLREESTMKTALAILALMVATCSMCSAQKTAARAATPQLLGHTLGESPQDFKIKAAGYDISDCPHDAQDNCTYFSKDWEHQGEAKFVDDKLVEITLTFINTPWSKIYSNSVAKFGAVTTSKIETIQNGFGARWNLRTVFWTRHGYDVILSDNYNEYANEVQTQVVLIDHKYLVGKNPVQRGNALE